MNSEMKGKNSHCAPPGTCCNAWLTPQQAATSATPTSSSVPISTVIGTERKIHSLRPDFDSSK